MDFEFILKEINFIHSYIAKYFRWKKISGQNYLYCHNSETVTVTQNTIEQTVVRIFV